MDAGNQFSLLDFITLAWLNNNDIVFHIRKGILRGNIILKGGKMVYAAVEGQASLPGHKAFQEIVSWELPDEVSTAELNQDFKQNISVSTKNLIQQVEESNRKRIRRS